MAIADLLTQQSHHGYSASHDFHHSPPASSKTHLPLGTSNHRNGIDASSNHIHQHAHNNHDEVIVDQQNGSAKRARRDTLDQSNGIERVQFQNAHQQNSQHLDARHQPEDDDWPVFRDDGVKSEKKKPASTNTTTGKSQPGASSAQQPVRRRISRACDQCNQLRTKCDGKQPCAHCVEFGLVCEYARARKKRGKVSKKELAAQQAAEAANGGGGGNDDNTSSANDSSNDDASADAMAPPEGQQRPKPRAQSHSQQQSRPVIKRKRSCESRTHSLGSLPEPTVNLRNSASITPGGSELHNFAEFHRNMTSQPSRANETSQPPAATAPNAPLPPMMGEYTNMEAYQRAHGAMSAVNPHPGMMPPTAHGSDSATFSENPYSMPSPASQAGLTGPSLAFAPSPMGVSFLGQSPTGATPNWMNLPSPNTLLFNNPLQQVASLDQNTLRYPVLQPLLPYIHAIMPVNVACDLLDLYFASTSTTFMHPVSPYILAYIFRKWSFLRQHNPRRCSPALLASMLWIAAQTSDAAYLTSPITARARVCQQLLEVTIMLLRPLVHQSTTGAPAMHVGVDGIALGGFGVALNAPQRDMAAASPGSTAAVDDIVTYMHLATVVSASEYKAASLRWWNVAWSLARELKLGRELPPNNDVVTSHMGHEDAASVGSGVDGQGPGYHSEEEREERRRIWWLLYCVDRHLALCYNRPLFLIDAECETLLHPEDETIWQAGEFYPNDSHTSSQLLRSRGPSFECTGHSIFGYFMPLMTILGEIVDLNQARNHPRLGAAFRNGPDYESQVNEITLQLDAYERSLKAFEVHNAAALAEIDHSHPSTDPNTDQPQQPQPHKPKSRAHAESQLQTSTVVAYGTHLLHTMHILLNGKWDPISLLDNNDSWIFTQSFLSASSHAVSAAEAIDRILDEDPDLSFMPWFFGIYLLQGSFLLLLIADKLANQAKADVVKACETIVRAHEACIVTLNTEYQRNFRRVMRSALAQVRGRSIEDFGEQQQRRREVLALYRWTGDGTGLAL